MNIFLMCQGQQRRLAKLDQPKHLLEVGGEAILKRTTRLLFYFDQFERAHGRETRLTVVGPRELVSAVGHASHAAIGAGVLHDRQPGACIVDGILATSRLWDYEGAGRTLILLGDVVWSKAGLGKFLADTRPVVFAGQSVLSPSQGEVFALGFDNPQAMKNLCSTCPCRVDGNRLRAFKHQVGGHLRRLLWHYQDLHQLRIPATRQSWHPSVYLPIDDWTNDIDTPEDVLTLAELGRLAELEDRGDGTRTDPQPPMAA